jgi:hypothetical protein
MNPLLRIQIEHWQNKAGVLSALPGAAVVPEPPPGRWRRLLTQVVASATIRRRTPAGLRGTSPVGGGGRPQRVSS